MADRIQVAVLGAGPGGYAAAFYAADLGMQVALIDEEKNPGGVCLYRGCIPSKALLHVAKVVDEARHAGSFGVTFGEPTMDVDKLRGFKQGVVDKLTAGVGGIAKMRKVRFVQGRATLTGPSSLRVDGGDGQKEIQFEHLILATGSHPTQIPSLSLDSDRMMDSTSGLEIPDIPKTMLVIGGGYIGLELGSVYAATMLVFVDDESDDWADTRAFLARRIEGIMRFEKAKAKLAKAKPQFSVTKLLGRMRYPAT